MIESGKKKMKLAFFCTGDGSFLKFIILNYALLKNVVQIVLLCDRNCGIYDFCKDKIPTRLIDRKVLGDKKFEKESCKWLKSLAIDYIMLSCNHVLRYDLLKSYGEDKQKMFNCHPSLLPNYIGMRAVYKSYVSSDLVYGATIHYVIKDVDMGKPVARCVLIKEQENFTIYSHKLFVNQAFLMINFIYHLSIGWGGGNSLPTLTDLQSLKSLQFLGFYPKVFLDVNDVLFFSPNDKELLGLK